MLFYIGIALGRFLSGIISERLGDIKLIITGTTMTILSLLVMIIPGIEGIKQTLFPSATGTLKQHKFPLQL